MAAGFELGRDGPCAIVVGVDGSRESLRAAAYAVGLARREQARLIVVYVRRMVSSLIALSAGAGEGVAAAYETQDGIEASLRIAVQEEIHTAGLDAEFVVRVGDPYTELTCVARDVCADGVVVGSSASPGQRIAGSLAVRLVRSGQWPVTVVP